jgi:hypothetical protein
MIVPAPSLRITAAAAAMLACVLASGALAQTTTPKAKAESGKGESKWSVPTTKTAPAKRAAACSQYGEGFVQLPGSDTCVKAGGYLRTEVGVSR